MSAAYRLVRGSSLMALAAGMTLPLVAFAQSAPIDQTAASAAIDAQDGVDATRTDTGDIVVTALRYVPSGAITASKTTAPLIETPQSVSVISRDQIDLLNFTDVQQAVRYTAGVVGENYGPDMRFDFLTLRGFIPVQYIDGLQAPVSATIANVGVDLYGFDSVDILKGPAGALYGTTPPGGIYNLTSRRPSSSFGGNVQVNYGTEDFKQIAGTVTGAVADGISVRLTGLYRDRDGQADDVTARRFYIAPAATFELGSNTKITALGYYQYDKVKGDTNGFYPALGVLYPNPVGTVSRSVNLGEPDYNFYRRKQWSAGYEFTHRFSSDLRFTQNLRWSGYHEYQQIIYPTGLADDDRTVLRSNYPYKDDVSQFAVDSRFDAKVATGPISHRILLGLDYRNYRERSVFGFGGATSIDLFDPQYTTTPIEVPPLSFAFTNQRLRQTGLYVQDQAKIGGFILTLSGRQDWMNIRNYNASTNTKQDKFTYRIGGTYITDAGVGPYISYATSFQPQVGQTKSGTAFAPSTGDQWEGGIKFDGRRMGDDIKIFATAALFRIRQSNVPTTDPSDINFQVLTGEVESKGVELEVVTRIHKQLSINASYSYTDAKVTKSNILSQENAPLAAMPKNKASLFVDYTVRGGTLAGFGGGAGVRYLSSSPGVSTNVRVDAYYSPATTLFDAALHYDLPGWRIAVNGSNLFDKKYAGRCTSSVGCFWGQERMVTATLTKRF